MQENDMEKFDSLNQVANGIMRRALDNNSDNLVGVTSSETSITKWNRKKPANPE